jgi:hypothetical protein
MNVAAEVAGWAFMSGYSKKLDPAVRTLTLILRF